MLSGDMARMQIADRVRDAEFDRRARGGRRQRDITRATSRRTLRAAVVATLVPGRH
jgi:hypothetical protein